MENFEIYVYVYLDLKARQQVIGARNEMVMDDYGGQMIFGDRVGLKQGSSTCGPRASFVRPGKGISQNTMRYEY